MGTITDAFFLGIEGWGLRAREGKGRTVTGRFVYIFFAADVESIHECV